MKYVSLLILACSITLLGGCALPKQTTNAENVNSLQEHIWIHAPKDYRCSEQAMERVEKETTFCKQNTGHSGRYCYGNAIIRICKKKIQY